MVEWVKAPSPGLAWWRNPGDSLKLSSDSRMHGSCAHIQTQLIFLQVKNLFSKDVLYFLKQILCVCVCVFVPVCGCRCPQCPGEDAGCLGFGGLGGCKLLVQCCEPKSGPLQEQYMLLAAKPCLQPLTEKAKGPCEGKCGVISSLLLRTLQPLVPAT